jgi:ABC-type glycerol-3-phosphate transport system substrate-binding protein
MHAISASAFSLRSLSFGVWVILSLFLLSGVLLLLITDEKTDALEMWVFSPEHQAMYIPMVEQESQTSDRNLNLSLLSIAAVKSRMMSGFFGGLPTADLIEVERSTVGQAFMGPVEAIGFRDITDQLKADGLLDELNAPSLSPWSVNGRVFGLPHDVHPVMLGYRADIVEAAGIDLTQAETWAEFFELLRPLMSDKNNDGKVDHFPLSFWYTNQDFLEVLLLQGGGQLFDLSGNPTIDSQRNIELLSTMISWCIGPERSVIDIDPFSAAGHQQRVDAKAIAYLCPDWMCSIWRMHVPGLDGKMKVMPLPAFEKGGTRTSVWGGTMLGFPRTSEHFEESWEFAKLLYTSPEVARDLYRMVDIITPVRSLWDDPVYDEPDTFFMGQAKGRMYIDLAPEIPIRTSSPYNQNAILQFRDSAVNLANWGNAQGIYDAEGLEEKASSLLELAQKNVVRQMSRNAFTGIENE